MARSAFTFRVALVGAESTGKSTLAQQLSARLAAPWVPEFARDYAARVARPLLTADVEPIARGQMRLEDHALASDPPLLILDTDLLSTVVYARHYYGTCPDWIVAEAKHRLSQLYLLMGTDIAFAPDAVRDRAEARDAVHERFRAELHAANANVVEIIGVGIERFESALSAISTARPDLIPARA